VFYPFSGEISDDDDDGDGGGVNACVTVTRITQKVVDGLH